MKRPFYFLLLFVILFLFSCNPQESKKIPPKAVKGVWESRGWDFEKDGAINLDGEWEFYWNELLEPRPNEGSKTLSSLHLDANHNDNAKYIPVPSQWQNHGYSSDGYATYRLRILLPENVSNESERHLSIFMSDAGTSYAMYIYGKLASVNGKVGKSKEESEPFFRYYVFSIDDSLVETHDRASLRGEIEILIHVSNYHHFKAGLWDKIRIGSSVRIEKEAKQKFALDLVVFSSLLIMALYHFGLFLNRRKDLSSFYFTALCFFFAIRVVSINERLILDVFPDLPFFFLIKLEYLSLYLGSYFFVSFIKSLFPEEFSKRVYQVISVISLSCSLIVVLFPMSLFTKTLTLVQITILIGTVYFYKVSISAILRKRLGAKLFLVGFALFMFAFVNDILKSMGILGTPMVASYGLLTMVISQAIILSRRFAGGFEEAERLSTDLEQKSNRLEETSLELSVLMQNLELKISERTKDLEETKKEIEELNTFSHLVNSLPDLNSIFIEISKYFYHKYGITGTWLFLPDEKNEYLYAYKAYSYHKLPAEKYDYLMNKKIPLNEKEGGLTNKIFQRKMPFYLSKIPKFEFGIDKEIAETLTLTSFLQVPLVRKEQCVGIFSFANLENEMKLSKSEIQKITNLCSQIAGAIDTNHLLQEVEKAKTQSDSARIEAEIERGISVIAKMEVEKAKQKTEGLNELIKKVNESSDLEKIMEIILTYVKDNYRLPYYSLFTLDTKEMVLKFANAVFPDYVTFEQKKFFSSSVLSVISHNKDSIHSKALALKTPIFIPDAETEVKTENGKAILKILKHKSFLTLPIILQNNPIGTLDFFSLEPIRLREEEITELSLLAEQLAGVIQGAILFTQVQEEKERALVAQKETEKQKQNTEGLNQLIKSLNEELDLKVIMQKVLKYVRENFGIQHYGLYNLNSPKTHIQLLDITFPDFVTEEDRKQILEFKIPIKNVKGAHAFSFTAKKPFYLSRIRKTGITQEELFIIEKYNIQSFLMIPLLLNNEPIGILDFSNSSEKMELTKDDFTRLSILGEQLAGIIHGSNLLQQVQEEKEKAELAKQEIETFNEFTKLINSTSDISTIFQEIYSYLNRTFSFTKMWVLLVDRNNKELYSDMNTTISKDKDFYDFDFFKNFRVKLDAKLGTLYQTYTAAVPLYVPDTGDIKTKTFTNQFNGITYSSSKTDLRINLKGKFKSLLQIPLILQNEVIGILCLSIFDTIFELNPDQIEKLVRFSNQIAGVIHNAQLLKQTEEAKGIANIEKENALVAREESEKAKAQIEFLNEFSKVINSFNNLDIIFSHAVENLSKKIETDIFQLQLVDKTKNELFTRCMSGKRSDLIRKYNKIKIPLISESGSLYLTYTSKKTLYLRNIKRIPEDKKTEYDKMVEKDFQLDSVFQIPLLVNEEVIGIMSCNKFGGMKKLSKDETRFVESLCEQLALAVNNSFLLEAAESERAKSEKLLLNILPKDVAAELKEKGFAEPVLFENVSVMFTDFKGFTTIAEKLSPQELIKDLDACFVQFDKISERSNLEKLKTIGDSYMCAGGIPKRNTTHAIDCCLAALEIQTFMNLMKRLKEEKGFPYWELRLGIHTGPLIAGVIGERKFAYDVWGDTVNTASRMESSGTPGRINISYSTYEIVKDYFACEYRGEVSAKNKGVVKMYYLDRIKPEFSKDELGLIPNGKFWEVYG